MNLNRLPVLSLLWAATAPAADLSPNKMSALLQKPLPASVYRLGLDYVQGEDAGDQRIIQRRLNLAIGLPAQLEFGFAILDTQEPAVDHPSKPLGAKAWMKWNWLQTSLFAASATLQYQPGLADAASSFQASQDRSSFGLDLNSNPLSWMGAAVYANYSRREDERREGLKLGAETVFGTRVSLGQETYGIYGDGLQRHLSAKDAATGASRTLFAREWQAGFYLGTESFQLKTYAVIPDGNSYFGMPQRGYGASFTMIVGPAASKLVDPRDELEDALVATEKPIAVFLTEPKSKAPEEAPIKILETNEMDEFQLLEKKNHESARNQKESANEKAERELRASLEAEKKQSAQKIQDAEKAQREALQAHHNRAQDAGDAERKYKDEVNEEVDLYTLPDQDDLNWNGLTP